MRTLLLIVVILLTTMLLGSLGWLMAYGIKYALKMYMSKLIEWYLRQTKKETRQLRELQEQLEQNKEINLKVKGYIRERIAANYVWVSIVIAFVATTLFIIAAVCCSKWCNFGIAAEDVVLAFVGIIATFIVVTNYAQVIEIKKSFDQQVYQSKKEYKNNLDKVVEERNRLITKHVAMLTKFCVAYNDKNLSRLASNLIENFKNDPEKKYTVEYVDMKGETNIQEISITFSKGELQFRRLPSCRIITKIDNVEIGDINMVNILVSRLFSISKK